MLYIKTFYFNPLRECTYIITAEEPSAKAQSCLIVDAGMYEAKEEQRLLDYLKENHLTPVAILLTHTHLDHICGVDAILEAYPDTPKYGYNYNYEEEDTGISLAGLTFRMLFTPGHKEDCVCYYFESDRVLFSGDTLFLESVGRTDLEGGDMATLVQSLARLKMLPDETEVYPGHGYPTTMAHEKRYNPYF